MKQQLALLCLIFLCIAVQSGHNAAEAYSDTALHIFKAGHATALTNQVAGMMTEP